MIRPLFPTLVSQNPFFTFDFLFLHEIKEILEGKLVATSLMLGTIQPPFVAALLELL